MIRVLIVDDSLTIRAMIEQVLAREADMRVVGIAGSAEEAHRYLRGQRPDVMTLDIAMPGMDGLSFLSEVMREDPLPVLMLSAATANGSAACEDALARGAVGHFDKAKVISDAKALVKAVRQAARQKVRAF